MIWGWLKDDLGLGKCGPFLPCGDLETAAVLPRHLRRRSCVRLTEAIKGEGGGRGNSTEAHVLGSLNKSFSPENIFSAQPAP
jgi:hypothetical protein